MPSIEDLMKKYDGFSDEKLYEMQSEINSYTPEAREALNAVLEKRGGLEKIETRLNSIAALEAEKIRVRKVVMGMLGHTREAAKISGEISSPLLSPAEISDIVDTAIEEARLEEADKAIDSRTIMGGIGGILGGGTIGGIVFGLSMIFSNRIIVIFIIGLILFNFSFIKFLTKKSDKNLTVTGFTVVAVAYSLILGYILYGIFGTPEN